LARLLIVDDESSIRAVLKALLVPFLEPHGHKIEVCASAETAMDWLKDHWCDVVLTDLRMDGLDGLEFLRQAKAEWPRIQFVLMSAHGSVADAVEALRLGAVDFLAKPLDHSALREKILQLLQNSQGEQKANLSPPSGDQGLIGQSPALRGALDRGRRAAVGDAPVLIHGESGTGKEVMARWIHNQSPRSSGPFVALNCGAIPENLVESELFGHEKGSFTGAHQSKPGKFELAQGGTLFLDEIAELPLLAQVKLLRTLQEKTVERVGGSGPKKVDFRLIAASHKNLAQMVSQGKFREDLFYRLNVIPLELPPLRERGEDLMLLAESILQKLNERYGSAWSLSGANLQELYSYAWPGNVRELENILERAVVLSAGETLEFDFPKPLASISVEASGIPIGEPLARVAPESLHSLYGSPQDPSLGLSLAEQRAQSEKQAILLALEACRWNRTHSAEKLGMSRRNLLYKMKAYGIE
jgi:DNA-binding NtrC family response regulator